MNDMERIQQGLEEFLRQEMAEQPGETQKELQMIPLNRKQKQENEREIDIKGRNSIGSTNRVTLLETHQV